jgi:hypothetical protein
MTSIGILNEGTVFLVALLYCLGETAESYTFFIEIIKQFILIESVPLPQVLLIDASAGMSSAISHGVLLNIQH